MEKLERKEELRRMLIQKKEELQKGIAKELGNYLRTGTIKDPCSDWGDLAFSSLEAEMGFTMVDLRDRLVEKIDDALARLEIGTYGICENCGIEISEARLKALPYATRCTECQKMEEKQKENNSHPSSL
jgi:DnaK suppressor protein